MPTKSRAGAIFESQWFSISLAALFGLAWAFPALAKVIDAHGWTKSLTVVVIFFMSGLTLKTREAIQGLANWRLHLYVQAFSFLLLPLATWLLLRPFQDSMPHGLLLGLYVLAALPTTITSCVVLTQLAGGSFAGALFNAILANLTGIVLTPLLLMLMIGSSNMAIELDALGTFIKLGKLILAPLVVGQVVRQLLGEHVRKIGKSGSIINRCGVLLIVYIAFGETFSGGVFRDSVGQVALPLALLVPAHLAVLWLAWAGSGWLRFARADRIAIVFCAPQKTLSMGLPLVAAILATSPELVGLASLPIIVYHPVQLLAAGLLVDRLRDGEAVGQ